MAKPQRDKNRSKNGKREPNGGRFQKGNQASKGKGRPKKDFDLETVARDLSEPILRRFAEMGEYARTPQAVAAGKVVLAYGWGNPRERKEHSGPGGGPIPVASSMRMTTAEARDELEKILATARGGEEETKAEGVSEEEPDEDAAGRPE